MYDYTKKFIIFEIFITKKTVLNQIGSYFFQYF